MEGVSDGGRVGMVGGWDGGLDGGLGGSFWRELQGRMELRG
jgi:hypothetical protein